MLSVRRLLLGVTLLALVGCADLRVKMGVFNSADEARRGGAMTAGWVPDGIPATATDLRVGYMPDGRHWGVFAFPAGGASAVRGLTLEEITSGTLECQPPGRLEFWPRVLFTPIDLDRVRATGFRLYRGADARTYAINWGQGRAYYWRG